MGKRAEEKNGYVRRVKVSCFFFKQKEAYEVGLPLVGSEMCLRDSLCIGQDIMPTRQPAPSLDPLPPASNTHLTRPTIPLA